MPARVAATDAEKPQPGIPALEIRSLARPSQLSGLPQAEGGHLELTRFSMSDNGSAGTVSAGGEMSCSKVLPSGRDHGSPGARAGA